MLIQEYPYLTFSLGLLGLFGVAYWSFPGQRRPILLGAVLSAPYAFASLVFVPAYWNPVRLVTFLRTGPEDLLFSFATGGLAWLAAVWPVRAQLVLRIQPHRLIRRYLALGACGILLVVFCRGGGLGVMTSSLAAMLTVGAYLLWRQRDLWVLSAAGAAVFAVFYFVFVFACFALSPEFPLYWNGEHLWGLSLAGVPVDELAWSAGFGGVWPLLLAHVFDARRLPPAQGLSAFLPWEG